MSMYKNNTQNDRSEQLLLKHEIIISFIILLVIIVIMSNFNIFELKLIVTTLLSIIRNKVKTFFYHHRVV